MVNNGINKSLFNNKYLFVTLSSVIASSIIEFVLFHRYPFYSRGDNMFPLSTAFYYNYQPFFTNVNGGSPGNNLNLIILSFFYFVFFNKYGEMVSFLVSMIVGNSAISLLIYKNITRQNIGPDVFHFATTILSEMLLSSGLNLYYEMLLLPNTFIPIYAVFPWIIYLLDSIVNDDENLLTKFLEIVLASLLLILFPGPIFTLVLPVYFVISLFFIVLLFFSKLELRRKLVLFGFSLATVLVLNLLSLLPTYFSVIPYFSSHIGGEYFKSALMYYVNNFNGGIFNVLTLTYYPTSTISLLSKYYVIINVLDVILLVLSILYIDRTSARIIYYVSIISFLLLGGWLAAPYLFPSYIELYTRTPVLWSLDIPWLSFTYFLFLSASLAIGNGLILIKNKKIKILSIFLLLTVVSAQLYPYYVGNVAHYAWDPPDYLWEIADLINKGPYQDPRILVLPTSVAYVAYNFSAGDEYVGVGFWPTLLKGDVYSSYFPLESYSLEWFISLYPALNFTSYEPLINAAKILGINYIIITKNIIPKSFIPIVSKEKIANLAKAFPESSIIYNNSQMIVYNFSSEQVATIPEYLIFINDCRPLWILTPSGYNSTIFHVLLDALNLSFVNYSSAALVCSKYEKEILNSIRNYTMIYNNDGILIVKIDYTPPKIKVDVKSPSNIVIQILNFSNSSPIPILIRENYFESTHNYIENYSKLIPGYSNESFIIIPSSSIITIDYSTKDVFQYIYIIYAGLAVIIIIVLVIMKNDAYKRVLKGGK